MKCCFVFGRSGGILEPVMDTMVSPHSLLRVSGQNSNAALVRLTQLICMHPKPASVQLEKWFHRRESPCL